VIRCIVLDLDDTLLDTSGLLVPRAQGEAARALIDAGLRAGPNRVARLRTLAARAVEPEQVDREVCRQLGQVPDGIAGAGERAFYDRARNVRRGGGVRLLPGARDVLNRLRHDYPLVLMTSGVPETQRAKIECVGIEPFFTQVIVLERGVAGGKRAALSRLQRSSGWLAREFLVVGDGWDAEILAGVRLGMFTCWVNRGEGRRRHRWPPLTPNAVITGPRDIPCVVGRLDGCSERAEMLGRRFGGLDPTWRRRKPTSHESTSS